MDTSKFVKETEVTVIDWDEGIYQSQEVYNIGIREIRYRDLQVNEQGFIVVGNEIYTTTEAGLIGLCKRLGIPDPFAHRIPFDLLQTNIHRLLSERSTNQINVMHNTNRTILNFMHDTFVPVNNTKLLTEMRQKFPNFPIKISIGDRGMDLDVISFNREVEVNRENKVGDIIRAGLRLSSSHTGFWSTKANVLLQVLRCTNGAVMPSSWGEAKMRLSPEKDAEKIYKDFFNQIIKLTPSFDRLTGILSKSPNSYLTDATVLDLWKRLTKNVGLDTLDADSIIGWVENQRELINSQVRTRKIANKMVLPGEEQEDQKTDIACYDVFDRMTFYANDCHQIERKKLQQLSGNLLTGIGLN